MILTKAQRRLVDQLKRGARIKLRITNSGRIGDFLILRNSEVVDVIPRATMAAVCQIGRKPPGRKQRPHEAAAIPSSNSSVPVRSAPLRRVGSSLATDSNAQMLDDIARGMTGKAFVRLNASDQQAVCVIAERISGGADA